MTIRRALASRSTREMVRSANDPAAVCRALIDSFNAHDADKAASLVATDGELVQVPSGVATRGPAQLRADLQAWFRAFPDAKCEITHLFCEGEMVSVELVARGTHREPFTTGDGTVFPATGNVVELSLCEVVQVRNSKIVRARGYWDTAAMMQQVVAGRSSLPH